jgi:glycosidase
VEGRSNPTTIVASDENSLTRVSKPFIAVNILPPREYNKATFNAFSKEIKEAQKLGFTHIWLNPIAQIDPQSQCTRRDLDTGLLTTQYQSSYDYKDPYKLNSFFNAKETKELLRKTKEENKLQILVDFAWMYVAGFYVFNKNNVCTDEVFNKQIKQAKQVIDFYLRDLSFSGVRIDGASHLKYQARNELYQYIRETYPHAIIFEEVLFDRTLEDNIKQLVQKAEEKQIYSDGVTSNIYYQKTDAFGALPLPEKMGDGTKIRLANNNGIGFTGNHDHFSVGWCTVLLLAAKKAAADKNFIDIVGNLA